MSEPPDAPPVDLEAFRMSMREGGIEEIVDETIEEFLRESPVAFAALEQAIASRDGEEIEIRAHALKSSSGTIRARRLAELLRQIERLGKEGDLAGVADFFPDVASEYRAVMDYLAG